MPAPAKATVSVASMPEFHARIPEQEAWTRQVRAGESSSKRSTPPFRDRYGPNSVQVRQTAE